MNSSSLHASKLQPQSPSLAPRLVDGRISSSTTPFLKWFPFGWTAFSLVIVSVGIGSILRNQVMDWFGLALLLSILALVLGVGGCLIKLFGGCADEVIVHGDQLLVRKGSQQVTVDKRDIDSIHFYKWVNPPIAKIKMRNETALGLAIYFFAPIGTSAFAPSSKLAILQAWLASDA